MTTAGPTPASTPAPGPAPTPYDEAHGEDHVHLYETSGIREGNARVPRWLVAVIASLFLFFGWYVVTQIHAQPSTAQMK